VTAPPTDRAARRGAARGRRAPATPAMHERFRDRRRAVHDARERERRRRERWAAVAAAVLVAAGATAASPLFAVTDVAVRGLDEARQSAFARALGLGEGDHLLLSDLPAAERRAERLPWVAAVDTRRRLPGTLEVTVVMREPVAVVRLADSSWLVDREGVVVAGGSRPAGSRAELPDIEAPEAGLPGLGEQVEDPATRAAVQVLDRLPADLALRVERIEARGPRDVWLHLAGSARHGPAVVRFGAAEAVEAKAQALALLLEGDGTGAGIDPGAAVVDVRAPANPVLVPPG